MQLTDASKLTCLRRRAPTIQIGQYIQVCLNDGAVLKGMVTDEQIDIAFNNYSNPYNLAFMSSISKPHTATITLTLSNISTLTGR